MMFTPEHIKQLENAFEAENKASLANGDNPKWMTPMPFNAKLRVQELLKYLK